jgi:hypothetical protein
LQTSGLGLALEGFIIVIDLNAIAAGVDALFIGSFC